MVPLTMFTLVVESHTLLERLRLRLVSMLLLREC